MLYNTPPIVSKIIRVYGSQIVFRRTESLIAVIFEMSSLQKMSNALRPNVALSKSETIVRTLNRHRFRTRCTRTNSVTFTLIYFVLHHHHDLSTESVRRSTARQMRIEEF